MAAPLSPPSALLGRRRNVLSPSRGPPADRDFAVDQSATRATTRTSFGEVRPSLEGMLSRPEGRGKAELGGGRGAWRTDQPEGRAWRNGGVGRQTEIFLTAGVVPAGRVPLRRFGLRREAESHLVSPNWGRSSRIQSGNGFLYRGLGPTRKNDFSSHFFNIRRRSQKSDVVAIILVESTTSDSSPRNDSSVALLGLGRGLKDGI